MKRITFISDPHNLHESLNGFLPGGDILLCGGDITRRGYKTEITNFCSWFDKIDNYDHKIFIAGNHDYSFQDIPDEMRGILTGYKTIDYLEDELLMLGEESVDYEDMIKVYGTPWSPKWYSWAFNVERGEEMKQKRETIPMNTDILIVHSPPFGKLDRVGYENVGCEDLKNRIDIVKPKIVVCGHVHEGFGYVRDEHTHYFNAAITRINNGNYNFRNKPITVDWDRVTNEINFVENA
jgi:Icc-related predicted phosphoesterase